MTTTKNRLTPTNGQTKKPTVEFFNPKLSDIGEVQCQIIGTAPLIQNKFPLSALEKMKDKVTGKADAGRKPRDPMLTMIEQVHAIGRAPVTEADLKTTDFAHPALAFKQAIVRAAKDDKHMTETRIALWVACDGRNEDGDGMVRLITKPPIIRTAPQRNANASMDIRFWPIFTEWSATLRVRYITSAVTAEQLTAWIGIAGQAVGIGVWRPGGKMSTGEYGTFTIESAQVLTNTK